MSNPEFSSSVLLLSSLELRDSELYEPSIRARLGTAAHFFKIIALKLRACTGGTLQGYLAHKKRTPLGPYRRPMPRVLGGS